MIYNRYMQDNNKLGGGIKAASTSAISPTKHAKKSSIIKKQQVITRLLVLAAIIVVVNLIANKAFFRLEFGELIALSQGLESRSEGVETHIESDDAIFQSEVVEDKEDDVRVEIRRDKQQR